MRRLPPAKKNGLILRSFHVNLNIIVTFVTEHTGALVA